jgi:hypothetical protein
VWLCEWKLWKSFLRLSWWTPEICAYAHECMCLSHSDVTGLGSRLLSRCFSVLSSGAFSATHLSWVQWRGHQFSQVQHALRKDRSQGALCELHSVTCPLSSLTWLAIRELPAALPWAFPHMSVMMLSVPVQVSWSRVRSDHCLFPALKPRGLLSVVIHACNPSYWGGGGRRIASSRPALARGAVRPCFRNKLKKEKQKIRLGA